MSSVNQLIQIRQAFGIPDSVIIRSLPIVNISRAQIGQSQNGFEIPQGDGLDPELYKSLLGTPVYTNIEFLSDRYETNTKGKFIDTLKLRFDAVLLTVTQAKNIVKTKIQGRDGTTKEYIGMDDYQIQINGIITGPNGRFPSDDVSNLKQILDAPIPIPVASSYLNSLGINSIVVEQYELGQEAGGYSYQTFSVTCSSDVPQELRLTNV